MQVPKRPRDHFTEWRRATTQEEYDAWYEEQSERAEAEENDQRALEERDRIEAVVNKKTGFHKGESRHVRRSPSLDRIEGGQRPVPPLPTKKPEK